MEDLVVDYHVHRPLVGDLDHLRTDVHANHGAASHRHAEPERARSCPQVQHRATRVETSDEVDEHLGMRWTIDRVALLRAREQRRGRVIPHELSLRSMGQ
ncbi:hypothetical protein [Micromonospora echinofusca]|uniref:hypothetical protein n=1 Tax=Micromonospora echinofusca TaxID=47858 RepID=UPI001FCE2625|nr:hypothetical protein [Micromonospora echinofusca]